MNEVNERIFNNNDSLSVSTKSQLANSNESNSLKDYQLYDKLIKSK